MSDLQPFVFDLSRPWSPYVPPRSMGNAEGSAPLYRDVYNMHVRDGMLTGRGVQRRLDLTGPSQTGVEIPVSAMTVHIEGEEDYHAQVPRLIMDIDATGEDNDFIGDIHRLVVTSREIYYQIGATWANITPEHEAGRVDVAVGSKNVTGTSTTWADRGIHNNSIELPNGSGDWYAIDSVTNNTALVLVTAYKDLGSGALVGADYMIRRTMHQQYDGQGGNFFAHLFDGDLYVGGDLGHNNGDNADGMVIKYESVASGAISSSKGTIIFGGDYAYETTVDNVGYRFFIRGMDQLSDGRVVVAGPWADSTTSGGARILYSSHLNVAVWTLAPGGAFDIAHRESELTALGALGNTLTCHFFDGISLLYPTGMDDPPLSEQPTEAARGAVSPMALVSTGEVEIYPSGSWTVEIFDGNRSYSAGPQGEEFMRGFLIRRFKELCHAHWDDHRGIFYLFVLDNTTGGNPGTPLWTSVLELDPKSGEAWKTFYGYPIGAALMNPMHSNASMGWNKEVNDAIIGIPNWDNEAGADSPMLRILTQDGGTVSTDPNSPTDNFGTNPPGDPIQGCYVDLDELDFGAPGRFKYIKQATLVSRGGGASEDHFVSISRDVRTTWEDETKTVADAPTQVEHYFFEETQAESFCVRVGLGTGAESSDLSMKAKLLYLILWVGMGALDQVTT